MNIFKTIEPYNGTRNRAEIKSSKDISVNVVKGTSGAIDNISFALKNSSYERISDSDHIGFEIFEDPTEDRIVIKFFNGGVWKLVKMKNQEHTRYFKAKLDEGRLALANKMVGSFDLCRDPETKCYYIQKVMR